MDGITTHPISVESLVDDAGKGYEAYQVTYMVDDDGPFTRYFPVQGFSEQEAAATIEAHAEQIRAFRKRLNSK